MESEQAIDELARACARDRYALPLCLHIPVAARDRQAIETYIGRVERVLLPSHTALLVHAFDLPAIDPSLPIWEKPGVGVLRRQTQVWVHVDERRYRAAYTSAFPEEEIGDQILDHVLNRRVARLKGFHFLRIVPISRGANSSSGGLSEKWAVAYHSTPEMIAKNAIAPPFIQYADLADLVKMLDVKTGGSLQDPVNEAQAWVRPASINP